MKAFCPRKGHCFYALILNRPNGLFVLRIQIFAKVEGARKYSCLRVRSLCARRWYSRNAGGAHAWAPLWYKYGLPDAKNRGRICHWSAHTCEFSGVDFSSIYFEKRGFVGCLSSFCSRNSARFEFSKEVLNIFRRLLPCPSKLFRKAFMVTHVVFNSVIHSSNVSGNIGLSCIHQMQSFGCIVVCM